MLNLAFLPDRVSGNVSNISLRILINTSNVRNYIFLRNECLLFFIFPLFGKTVIGNRLQSMFFHKEILYHRLYKKTSFETRIRKRSTFLFTIKSISIPENLASVRGLAETKICIRRIAAKNHSHVPDERISASPKMKIDLGRRTIMAHYFIPLLIDDNT